jgi:hypothetical protein
VFTNELTKKKSEILTLILKFLKQSIRLIIGRESKRFDLVTKNPSHFLLDKPLLLSSITEDFLYYSCSGQRRPVHVRLSATNRPAIGFALKRITNRDSGSGEH